MVVPVNSSVNYEYSCTHKNCRRVENYFCSANLHLSEFVHGKIIPIHEKKKKTENKCPPLACVFMGPLKEKLQSLVTVETGKSVFALIYTKTSLIKTDKIKCVFVWGGCCFSLT